MRWAALLLCLACSKVDDPEPAPAPPPPVVTQLVVAAPDAAPARDPRAEEAQVREVWNTYKQAVLGNDGPAAVESVDQATLAYYDGMRQVALSATPERIKRLGIFTQVQVLALRAGLGRKKLESLTGLELFRYLVEERTCHLGMRELSLGRIIVHGDMARGLMTVRGNPVPLGIEFHREDGRWGLRVANLFGLIDWVFGEVAKRQGGTETVVRKLFAVAVGKRLSARHFQPLVR